MNLQKENLLNEELQEIEIFDKPGLFSNGRLRDEEVPEGLYRYDLRGSDYDPGQPITVEKTVVVNHAASVLMAEELDLGADGRLELGEEGLNFTGAELTVREFITRTHKELDLTRQDAVEEFFAQEKPEYVFLAAAKVGGIVANQEALADFMYDNMTLEMNAIHSAWKNGCKKLEFLGSSCIYPRMAPQPMQESCLLTSELEKTNEAYGTGHKVCPEVQRRPAAGDRPRL